MPNQEDIMEQQELLQLNRRNLALYLKQQTMYGIADVPLRIVHGINESRASIQRIKTILRLWGVVVDDHPNDLPSAMVTDVVDNYPDDNFSNNPGVTSQNHLQLAIARLMALGCHLEETTLNDDIIFQYMLVYTEQVANPIYATKYVFLVLEHQENLDLPTYKKLRENCLNYAASHATFLPITYYCFIIPTSKMDDLVVGYVLSTPHVAGAPMQKAYAAGVVAYIEEINHIVTYDIEKEKLKSLPLRFFEYILAKERYELIETLHKLIVERIMSNLE